MSRAPPAGARTAGRAPRLRAGMTRVAVGGSTQGFSFQVDTNARTLQGYVGVESIAAPGQLCARRSPKRRSSRSKTKSSATVRSFLPVTPAGGLSRRDGDRLPEPCRRLRGLRGGQQPRAAILRGRARRTLGHSRTPERGRSDLTASLATGLINVRRIIRAYVGIRRAWSVAQSRVLKAGYLR